MCGLCLLGVFLQPCHVQEGVPVVFPFRPGVTPRSLAAERWGGVARHVKGWVKSATPGRVVTPGLILWGGVGMGWDGMGWAG